jgi:hypothetical protein
MKKQKKPVLPLHIEADRTGDHYAGFTLTAVIIPAVV